MLDVRRLRLLRELHERGTVTAVAEALAYTPSAVLQQLATLEREAGVPLMERQGRRLRLTDAGRGLVEHADAVIARRASCCRCSGRCRRSTRGCASSCSRWRPRRGWSCSAAARST
jgi:DNA-binding transcriptional LysR family regulator